MTTKEQRPEEPTVIGDVGPTPMPTAKEEWIAKCAARYIEKANLDRLNAFSVAESLYEYLAESEETMLPEEAADEDMSYWTDDGDSA